MKIEWEQTGDDPNDLIAKVGKDTLRVERMDKRNFWWCVYIGDLDFHSYEKFGKSLGDAKQKCELKYKELKNDK